jgi:hypothetical protein
MLLFELFLNIAHQILKGGEKALMALHPDNQDLYDKNREQWEKLFKEYS